jgi:hypothetical protein
MRKIILYIIIFLIIVFLWIKRHETTDYFSSFFSDEFPAEERLN